MERFRGVDGGVEGEARQSRLGYGLDFEYYKSRFWATFFNKLSSEISFENVFMHNIKMIDL